MNTSRPDEKATRAAFPPPAELRAHANATARDYTEAEADRLGFWARQAERITWTEPFDTVLDWSDRPFARWFVGGRLNVAYNCVDRHVEAGRGDQVALHFVGEPGDTRDLTYADLQREVSQAAHALTELGVRSGDRVAIYLPMIPEAIITMLACARIGAPHTVVFGGFSADALVARIDDCDARVVVTADGGFRRGRPSPLKMAVDEARTKTDRIRKVVVVRRTGQEVAWEDGVDVWWHDLVSAQPTDHACESFDSEQPLFVMFTSGSTGRPKGILHTSGGYLAGVAYTHRAVFDLKPETDVYWCTADLGWITGHSYVVYGPLANGATQVLYEGTPESPHRGRWWEIVEKYGVTILYTAPTAIRTFMRWGEDVPERYDLRTIRILGSAGEPINPEAYVWFRDVIGGAAQGRETPVVDTWWQTESGMIMISPLPGVTTAKPGAAMAPVPGVSAAVVDANGTPVAEGESGFLVVTEPWPAMLRGLWNDDARYVETYWEQYAAQNWYFAGDGAKYDSDGDLWVLGRVDDVMNVSGHRLSTSEIESALVAHPAVAEAAVIGAADPTTGQAVVAFVILRDSANGGEGSDASSGIAESLRQHVGHVIGPIAKPKQVVIVPELPKTRSGKIMRRLLRAIAEDRPVGDVTTLADSSVMDLIAAGQRPATG